MFIKLVKKEMNDYYKLMRLSIIALAIGCLCTSSNKLTIIVLFGLECALVVLCSIVYTFSRAYKTMASENAYYTFSIPAKHITILISKISAASIANIVIVITVLASMLITRTYIMDEINADWFKYFGKETGIDRYSIIYNTIFSHFDDYVKAFSNLNVMNVVIVCIVILGFFVTTTSLIYLSVLIGQIFSDNKMFASAIITFAFAIIISMLKLLVWGAGRGKYNIIWGGSTPIEKDFIPHLTEFLKNISSLGCIIEIIIVFAATMLALVIMNNKLNIKAE